ncbi:hypothetical protein ACI79J_04250 [Geodermatophilus sp. SYSU D01062]
MVQTNRYQEWRKQTIADPECGTQAEIFLLAMESQLRQMKGPPGEETATLKRVMQARRHPLWRVRHPYRENLALRIICYFPNNETVVLALLGFNKHPIGDIWYDRAAKEGEAMVDHYLRQQQ